MEFTSPGWPNWGVPLKLNGSTTSLNDESFFKGVTGALQVC